MAVKKITKRWLFNNMCVILVILLALIFIFAAGIHTFFYTNARSIVLAQANIVKAQLTSLSEDSSGDFNTQVRDLVETFSERAVMELMAVDIDGQVILTSSGFAPQTNPYLQQFQTAMLSDEAMSFSEKVNGEKIMIVVLPSPVKENQQLGAMQFAVSLERVDKQIFLFIMVLGLVAVAILFFVIFSSSYFINSIVNPVGEVGNTARAIAHGNFEARLQKQNDDEIGELCDTINYMAEELAANEKMKNEFISSVSHELRTPLTAIKGWAETLTSMGTEVDSQILHKGMRVINGETERLAQMVEELLDFSRLQSGHMQLDRTRIDLIAELSDAVLMFEERAKHEKKNLLYQEPDLIAPFYGDRNRLRQVFVNVIDNALKYTDEEDTITIKAGLSGSDIAITVEDTGLGIKETDLPRVREKFFKANSTRRGSGIGLAVANEIITMHSGSLLITSKEHVGTKIMILLPQEK